MSPSPERNHTKTEEVLSPETVIQLLDVYLTEWTYRDTSLWAHVYRYFYVTLIVMVLPNITSYLNIHLPPVAPRVFPGLGMVMTFFFFYISLGYAKRLEAIGNTYSNLIDTLPKQYRRVKIEDINGKVFQLRLSKLIIIIMTIALLIIGIIMLQA